MNNSYDKHEYKDKCGKIGPSYPFCEHSDLVGNIQRKFQKNSLANFTPEES